jgi:hypothetical protein
MKEELNKQTLYFAFYIDVTGMSPTKAKDTIANLTAMYTSKNPDDQYNEKIFFVPVKNKIGAIKHYDDNPTVIQNLIGSSCEGILIK